MWTCRRSAGRPRPPRAPGRTRRRPRRVRARGRHPRRLDSSKSNESSSATSSRIPAPPAARPAGATTSSMPSSVESSTTASVAWASGSVARVESRWSRRCRSAAVAAQVGGLLGAAPAGPLGRRRGQVDLEVGVRRDHRADVAALDHDARPRPAGGRDDLPLPGDEHRPDARAPPTPPRPSRSPRARGSGRPRCCRRARCAGRPGRCRCVSTASTAIFVTVSASCGSTPACSTAQVTARYIAPVSR